MRVFALISGGKDSCFNMMYCVREGHEIVALGNLHPAKDDIDELDSYMYQTVGHEAINCYAEAMDLPLFRRKIHGHSKVTSRDYIPDAEDEVEDLHELLKIAQESVQFDAVSCGAILSDYQRVRLESVCDRLKLKSLCYLWRRNQKELLQEMVDCDVNAVLIKTAALGLTPQKHLGKSLQEIQPTLLKLNRAYGSHCCGEGGEYETFTLDCPLFKKSIHIEEQKVVCDKDGSDIAPVGYLKMLKLSVRNKVGHVAGVDHLQMMTSDKWQKKFTVEDDDGSHPTATKSTIKQLKPFKKCVKVLGDMLSITGVTATCETTKSSPYNIEDATEKALNDITETLLKHDHQKTNVCYLHICIKHMRDYPHVNKVYKKHFELNPPARSCIECLESDRNEIFHIDLISARNCERRNMHVESISHWACANIGPFSQCVSTDSLLYLSGTIGLVPGSMELMNKGVKSQANAALNHLKEITSAMKEGCDLCNVVQCISYVINKNHLQMAKQMWKENCSSSNNCDPIYVAVDGLPKDALSEWQVIATPHEINVSTGESTYENTPLRWHIARMEGNEQSHLFLTISTSACHDQIIPHTIGAVPGLLSANGFNVSNVAQSRWFCTKTKTTDEELLQDYQATRMNVDEGCLLGAGGESLSCVLMCYAVK